MSSSDVKQVDAEIQTLVPQLKKAFEHKTWKPTQITVMVAKVLTIVYQYCAQLSEAQKKDLIERIFKQYLVDNLKFANDSDKQTFEDLIDTALPIAIDTAFEAKNEAEKLMKKACASCCLKA